MSKRLDYQAQCQTSRVTLPGDVAGVAHKREQRQKNLAWVEFALIYCKVQTNELEAVQAALSVDNCWQSQRPLFTPAGACSSFSCAGKTKLCNVFGARAQDKFNTATMAWPNLF